MPTIPSDYNQFSDMASKFIERAKANKMSNTAINNTITFMFNLFNAQKEDQAKKEEATRTNLTNKYKYIDVDGDGQLERVDTETGQVVQEYGSDSSDFADLSAAEQGFSGTEGTTGDNAIISQNQTQSPITMGENGIVSFNLPQQSEAAQRVAEIDTARKPEGPAGYKTGSELGLPENIQLPQTKVQAYLPKSGIQYSEPGYTQGSYTGNIGLPGSYLNPKGIQ